MLECDCVTALRRVTFELVSSTPFCASIFIEFPRLQENSASVECPIVYISQPPFGKHEIDQKAIKDERGFKPPERRSKFFEANIHQSHHRSITDERFTTTTRLKQYG
jgi:hypothetical protein